MGQPIHIAMIELSPDNGWIAKDEKGFIYPWYTAPTLEVLDKIDFTGKRVFEYGGGNSTLWYRSRGAVVCGVDSSELYAKFADIEFQETKHEYLHAIHKTASIGVLDFVNYDLIAIDGEWRDECTSHAFERIKEGGIIIIDNFMQPSVPPNEWFRTLDLLATKKVKYHVFSQTGHLDWHSLLIYA